MSTQSKLSTLVGQPLDSFKIEEFFEIVTREDRGGTAVSVKIVKDQTIADAIVEKEQKKQMTGTALAQKVFILTNGEIYILLNGDREVTITNDEDERSRLRENALQKLSKTDKELLGIKE